MTRPRGVGGFYVTAVACTVLSMDTSYRFVTEILRITRFAETIAMFAIVEMVLVSCGWAMRAGVRAGTGPGPARLVAWGICGVAAYMAVVLSGPVVGLARAVLGPILALVSLHLALGMELRHSSGERKTAWARVGREIRERLMSRVGLGDDSRDALARTRDRAADRAARLATAPGWVPARDARLARAIRASGAGVDPQQRARVTSQIAALRNISDLRRGDWESPWRASTGARMAPDAPHIVVDRAPRAPRSRTASTRGATAKERAYAEYATRLDQGKPEMDTNDLLAALDTVRSGAGARAVRKGWRVRYADELARGARTRDTDAPLPSTVAGIVAARQVAQMGAELRIASGGGAR